MSDKKHFRWLLDELPRLREQNLITAETENVLREHYAARLTSGVNYFMLALGILGVALIAGGFAHEVFKELRAFVPPVSVEFGVVGRSDVRRGAEHFFEVAALCLTIEEEVAGVFGCGFGCPGRNVRFFAIEWNFSGDAEEFEDRLSQSHGPVMGGM